MKIKRSEIIKKIQKGQMRNDLSKFNVGDTVEVSEKITEGKKTRIQKYIGVVIKIKGFMNATSFIARKESYGTFVEKTFRLHSPQIVKIDVIKKGRVRRAYLTYLRNRVGKATKIAKA